jgi:ankyrin repeat protein
MTPADCIKKLVALWFLVGLTCSYAGSYEDFFVALQGNDASTVSRLLEKGFDPNTLDEEGRPGLYVALQKESYAAASALMRHPQLNVNALNRTEESALMMAAIKGNLQWARRLLERGALVNKSGWTALHYAASGNTPEVLTLLLDQGAVIDARSPNGTTSIMMAASYGLEASVQLLIDRGADLQLQNDLGLTVIDFAERAGRRALADRLRKLTVRSK